MQVRPVTGRLRPFVAACAAVRVIRDTVQVVVDEGVADGFGGLDRSRAALLADAAGRAGRYLQGLADRAVAPSPEAVLALDELDFPLPEAGLEPARVLAALDEVGSPATVASAGPRYFGFVTGAALPMAVATAAPPLSVMPVRAAQRRWDRHGEHHGVRVSTAETTIGPVRQQTRLAVSDIRRSWRVTRNTRGSSGACAGCARFSAGRWPVRRGW
jgi:hypothetical protein